MTGVNYHIVGHMKKDCPKSRATSSSETSAPAHVNVVLTPIIEPEENPDSEFGLKSPISKSVVAHKSVVALKEAPAPKEALALKEAQEPKEVQEPQKEHEPKKEQELEKEPEPKKEA